MNNNPLMCEDLSLAQLNRQMVASGNNAQWWLQNEADGWESFARQHYAGGEQLETHLEEGAIPGCTLGAIDYTGRYIT